MISGVVENFLRRWSTVDITPQNAFLFEEHLMGVLTLATYQEQKLLDGFTRSTPRKVFAQRYAEITGIEQIATPQ